jgi:ribonucleotide monophosphatase NagD (HAD superfamily)
LRKFINQGKLDEAPKDFPEHNLPVLACNADMIWMAEAGMPRFGHGTFLHCLEQVYEKLSGRAMQYSAIVGKPSELTYYYSEEMIHRHAESIGVDKTSIKRLYAVGDNLDTDIYGANMFNQILENNKNYRTKHQTDMKKDLIEQKLSLFDKDYKFVSSAESISSILVQTGVFRGELTDIESAYSKNLAHKDTLVDRQLVKPTHITKDVLDAVKLVFERENYKPNSL